MTSQKSATRAAMMKMIRSQFTEEELFLKKAEDFYGYKTSTGIWTSGETDVFQYYGPWTHGLPYYISDKMWAILEKGGWHVEWNDPGTVMLYPNDN